MEAISSIGLKDPGSTGANISASRVGVAQIVCANGSGATVYFQFFDTLRANVQIGTTTPTFVLAVPTTQSVTVSPSVSAFLFVNGASVFGTTTIFGGSAAGNGHHVEVFVN